MPTSTRRALAALLVVVVAMPFVVGAFRDALQVLGELTCVALCWRALLPQRDLYAKGWALVVSGATVAAIADTFAALEVRVFHLTAFPRPSTIIVLIGYAMLGSGAVLFDRRRVKVNNHGGGVEAAIFGLGGLGPVLVFLVLPQLTNDAPMGSRASVVGYALADLMIMTVIARLMLTDSSRSRALLYLGAALGVSLGGDLVASLMSLSFQGSYATTAPAGMLWLLGFVLLAAGISHPSLRGLTYGTYVDANRVAPRSQVTLLAAGLLLPGISLAVALLLGDTRFLWVLAVIGLAVSALVATRITRLMEHIGEQSNQLATLARSDELTGLPNRRSWNHAVERACEVARSSRSSLCLVLFDLDQFKNFNDEHGHPAGDALLRRVAAVWSAALREGEFLARYGGEEFAMLLPDLDIEAAVERADELRRLVPAPQSASAGVASWVRGSDPSLTLAEADDALYLAKRGGRDRTVAAELTDSVPGPLRDLMTVMQPIVRLSDLAVVAHECLSRFPHTTDVEAVFADAHDKGYGDLLEAAAIGRSLEHPDRPGNVEVYVNASEKAMRSGRFWAELPADLHGVVVELSEHRDGMAEDELGELLTRFRERGARIGLDDVGSATTDFSRIGSLHPDVVKIDRSLVVGADTQESRAAVLRMLVGFAAAAGVEVCVEGVETLGELEVVRSTGATHAQGYLFGRPQPDWVAAVGITAAPRALI